MNAQDEFPSDAIERRAFLRRAVTVAWATPLVLTLYTPGAGAGCHNTNCCVGGAVVACCTGLCCCLSGATYKCKNPNACNIPDTCVDPGTVCA